MRYYEYLRENDLCLTHTLIPPQANRAVSLAKQVDPTRFAERLGLFRRRPRAEPGRRA